MGNIDVEFKKLQDELKSAKARIKTMKKEKKMKEKQNQMAKQKEQEIIIKTQRMQIDQLITGAPIATMNKLKHENVLSPARSMRDDQEDEYYHLAQPSYNTHYIEDPGVLNEGQFSNGGMGSMRNETTRQRPLLNEREWKIIGGVVIVLTGVYLIGKFLS